MKRDLSAQLLRHNVSLSAASLQSLKKLWNMATRKHKLSVTAKDRLALLAGFQSWNDFDDALHGDTDGSINYK